MRNGPVVREHGVAPGKAFERRSVRTAEDLSELLVLEHDEDDVVEVRQRVAGVGAVSRGCDAPRDRDRREQRRECTGEQRPAPTDRGGRR